METSTGKAVSAWGCAACCASGASLRALQAVSERRSSRKEKIAFFIISPYTAALSESFYSEEARVFDAERRVILELAEKGDCVIIGRCASAILRAAGYRPLSVFIYADSADRAKRIAARNNLDEKRALHKAQKVDRMRKHHFDFYADTLWGEPESYDLMLSSSEYGVSGAASVIASAKEAMRHE